MSIERDKELYKQSELLPTTFWEELALLFNAEAYVKIRKRRYKKIGVIRYE